jgi:hypothetical protein
MPSELLESQPKRLGRSDRLCILGYGVERDTIPIDAHEPDRVVGFLVQRVRCN